MARISYVNGRYAHHQEAMVHIEDRGYQFADGIYEYIAFYNGKLLDNDLHFARLERSLKELFIAPPMSTAAMNIIAREMIARNGREHGGLYIQVTRGVPARRDHPFPPPTKPALVMTICSAKLPKEKEIKAGVAVITYPDHRWERRDVKSIALLANVLAKQEATKKQAREAWLIESDGMVTEGAVSNSYIVTKSGEIITHPLDHHILGGVTRDVVLKMARKAGLTVSERAYSLVEAKNAAEAFLTSTSVGVLPVTRIDDKPVGDGKPGKVTLKLRELFSAHVEKQTGYAF